MRKIHIRVTEEHIARGIPGSVYACPIAVAIQDTLGRESSPVVDNRIRFYIDGRQCVTKDYVLPKPFAKFVRRFDHRLPVKPFGFTVTINALPDTPPPTEAPGAHRVP